MRVINATTSQLIRDVSVSVDTSSPIGPGGSRARSYSFTLPHGSLAVGDLRFEVTVDDPTTGQPKGGVYEYNGGGTGETNNTAFVLRPSTLANYPDLTVGNIELLGVDGPLGSGQQARIRWLLSNNGTAPTSGSWRDRIEIYNLDTQTLIYNESIQTAGVISAGGGTLQRPERSPGGAGWTSPPGSKTRCARTTSA